MSNLARAEIVVAGLVQGVGYRYFVIRNAEALGLKGYTQNLISGEVFNVIEGEKFLIEELEKKLRIGPISSDVKSVNLKWFEYKNEFKNFEVRY